MRYRRYKLLLLLLMILYSRMWIRVNNKLGTLLQHKPWEVPSNVG